MLCAGLFAFGTGSGTFDQDILLTNYDIILSDSNGLPLAWSLNLDLNSSSIFNGVSGTTGPGGSEITGSLVIPGLTGVTLSNWQLFFDVDFAGGSFNSGDTITVNIPGGSTVDIGASIPEPGTGWLLAIAGGMLAGVAAIRRRLSGKTPRSAA
jgi:hypothetical protein